MAAFLFDPYVQALDSSGVPYAGAKLYFYQSGTTTPITVYQDSGLTTPHANPVVADSAGRFAPIYISSTVTSYKTLLANSAGTTIQTVDPLYTGYNRGISDDLSGRNTVGGTPNAITITTAAGYSTLISGIRLLFKPSADNSGATTLNVDGIGAKAVRKIVGGTDVALVSGDLLSAQRTEVIYDSAANSGSGAWIVVSKLDAVAFNVAQTVTDAQKGQARANIGGDLLGAFRNKIINGDFDLWQRGTSGSTNGYNADDRWKNEFIGSSTTASQQTHTLGQTSVPGNPKFFARSVVTSSAGATNYSVKTQSIEGVQTLAGKTVTVTFYAKADASKNLAFEMFQEFGSGGSGSARITAIGARLCALTTAWQKFSFTVSLPSITGKTLGTNNNDFLGMAFWFDAGSSFNARTSSLGQQSGTFDISHVSVVEGDATAEADPFSPRHIGVERALCQRYFYKPAFSVFPVIAQTSGLVIQFQLPVQMRANPTYSLGGLTDGNFQGVGSPTGAGWALQIVGIAITTKTGTLTIQGTGASTDIALIAMYGATFSNAPNSLIAGPSFVPPTFDAEL